MTKRAEDFAIVVDKRMKTMNDMRIDMEILSIIPFRYGKDRGTGAKIVGHPS
jgi:aminocarboxymuconate-semialdehyde decarboxylase